MSRERGLSQGKIHLNLARLKKAGHNFEVDVDPDLAINYRAGKGVDIREVLKAQKVFEDVKKGLLASESVMMQVFNTSNALEVAAIIIKEGEIQLTAGHREKMRELKKKHLINIIHRYGVDPRTNAPHPMTRIENAFADGKIKVDEFKTAEEQVKEILRALSPILPIKFETKEIVIHIPSHYASSANGIIKQMSKVLSSNWAPDGSFTGTIEIPGGLEEDFFTKLNKVTHGTVTSRLVRTK